MQSNMTQQIGIKQGDEPHQAIIAQGEGQHTTISSNNTMWKHKVKNKQQQMQNKRTKNKT
jgi:hypothetical protein